MVVPKFNDPGPLVIFYIYFVTRRGYWINLEMPRNNISIIAVIALVIAGYGDGYAGEDKRPDISGVWANALLTPDDERWRIEDLACARSGCSLAGLKYLQALLANPENDGRSVKELFYEMQDYEKQQNKDLLTPGGLKKQAEYDPAQDAALDCTPEGDSLRPPDSWRPSRCR